MTVEAATPKLKLVDLVIIRGEYDVMIVDEDLGTVVRTERRPFDKLVAIERGADGQSRVIEILDGIDNFVEPQERAVGSG